MSIDYNNLAKDYDLTRTANINIINLFASELSLDDKNILDFGCGTGNFAYAIKKLTTAMVYGVEPSDGMREKALEKGINVQQGDHSSIPFEDGFFDLIYMTDVVHHVPDLKMMFAELNRVLKPNGFVCILTESHRQLETRFWTKYFPATIAVEKKRYPDIPDIINAAESAEFEEHKVVNTDTNSEFVVSENFVRLVENKGYSMFMLFEETDYETGLAMLKKDFEDRTMIYNNHGETLVWLKKRTEASEITYTDYISIQDYNMLREAVGWGSCRPERVQMALARSDFLISALWNGKTIGMARVVQDGLQALIMDVIVLPNHQGKGVGKALMKNVMKYIDELSRDGGIFVNLMSALGKDEFYKKFGFERRPNDSRGPGMTQWVSKEGIST